MDLAILFFHLGDQMVRDPLGFFERGTHRPADSVAESGSLEMGSKVPTEGEYTAPIDELIDGFVKRRVGRWTSHVRRHAMRQNGTSSPGERRLFIGGVKFIQRTLKLGV